MISVCHLLNDMMQTLLSAIYPLLQSSYGLSFAQIGIITLTFQGTASILQPMVGFFIDRNPRPYSLAMGMGLTLTGLVLFSRLEVFLYCYWRQRWWAPVPRFFIPNHPGWRGWLQGEDMGWRSRCFRWEAMPARP